MAIKGKVHPLNKEEHTKPTSTTSVPDVATAPTSHLKPDSRKLDKSLALQLASFPPPAPLTPRIVSQSERNLIRLRIWLSSYAQRLFTSRRNPCLLRFGPSTLVKFSPASRPAEATNIEYIARNTNIPVPRVHDVFVIDGVTYIIMDYIKASELTGIWMSYSLVQKRAIFAQLKDYIDQMRSLTPPHPGRLETADGNGLYDPRICLDGRPMGPFYSVAEFHTHLGHDTILINESHREYWSDFKTIAKRQYRTVFTHSDIAPRNILAKNARIVGIVDWETAGWYPEYWEYTCWDSSNYRSESMWHEVRDKILDRYPEELKVDQYVASVYTRL